MTRNYTRNSFSSLHFSLLQPAGVPRDICHSAARIISHSLYCSVSVKQVSSLFLLAHFQHVQTWLDPVKLDLSHPPDPATSRFAPKPRYRLKSFSSSSSSQQSVVEARSSAQPRQGSDRRQTGANLNRPPALAGTNQQQRFCAVQC